MYLKPVIDGMSQGMELHVMNNHEGVLEKTKAVRELLDGDNTLLIFLPTETAKEIGNAASGERSRNEDIEVSILDRERNEISRATFVVR